jgi:hypothetical protein
MPANIQDKGPLATTLTRSEVLKHRGGFEGNGAADMVTHHPPSVEAQTNGAVTAARACEVCGAELGPKQDRYCSREHANEGLRQAAGRAEAAKVSARGRDDRSPMPVPSNASAGVVDGASPAASWDVVLQRLSSAGFEVRGVVLADGWLLSRP